MTKDIVLIGGGGHCHSVIDVIESQKEFRILGIVDLKENIGKSILGYKVIGHDDDLKNIIDDCKHAMITVGQIKSNQIRQNLYKQTKKLGYILPTIVSPLAYVSAHASIQEGSVVMHHALVNAKAKIGKNCIINTKALIEHDAIIKDHCHIATGAIVNGGTCVSENTFVGSNATTKQSIEIEGFVKAGSVAK